LLLPCPTLATNPATMNPHLALSATGVCKRYSSAAHPAQRLWHLLWRGSASDYGAFTALHPIDLQVNKGSVLGVVGRNGAGKSTLLQLIAGTLRPTAGMLRVQGRVAALLELGAGFHPEFTGRENARLYGQMMGLQPAEIEQKLPEIITFSGIERFIDQPVKTYSSGMFVRLAFAAATSVQPEVLIVDEALSVGDGAFARKSFDRIMDLRAAGATIIFCSHALYQVQVLSDQVLWLEAGAAKALGDPRETIAAYQHFLDGLDTRDRSLAPRVEDKRPQDAQPGLARLTEVRVSVDGQVGQSLNCVTERSCLEVEVRFSSDPNQPCPSVAVVFTDEHGRNVSSCTTFYDRVDIDRRADGIGQVRVSFPALGLLHGRYWVNVLLMCERSIMTLDGVYRFVELVMEQPGHEVGVVLLPRSWTATPAPAQRSPPDTLADLRPPPN